MIKIGNETNMKGKFFSKQPEHFIETDRLGFKWLIRKDSFFSGFYHDKIGSDINHEIETFRLLRDRASYEKVFVDVGAHVGHYTVRLSRHYGQVIAIEPDPHNFEGLLKNLELNHVKNVHALNLAASSKRGNSILYSAGVGSRLDIVRLHKRVYNVHTDLLDKLVDHADVIKIDTEGHELEILKGASRLIAQKPILVIENHTKTYGLTYWSEILEQLVEFKPRYIEGYIEELYIFEPQNTA